MRHRPVGPVALVLAFVLSIGPAAAQAPAARFDGAWTVQLVCPPHDGDDDEAKGYRQQFPAEVVNGRLRATYGTEGEPGWHFLRGRIADDGSAALRLDGIVSRADHAINNAQRGKEYSYRVKAQFSATSGSGQRLTGRVCEFRFTR